MSDLISEENEMLHLLAKKQNEKKPKPNKKTLPPKPEKAHIFIFNKMVILLSVFLKIMSLV